MPVLTGQIVEKKEEGGEEKKSGKKGGNYFFDQVRKIDTVTRLIKTVDS